MSGRVQDYVYFSEVIGSMVESDYTVVRSGFTYGRGEVDDRVIGYKIFYTDKSVFVSRFALDPVKGQSEWRSAPGSGIQMIVLYFASTFQNHPEAPAENYNAILADSFDGASYYWRLERPEGTVYVIGNAQTPGLPVDAPAGTVKTGEAISVAEMRAINDEMMANHRRWGV